MSTKPTTATPAELAEEAAAWAVGGGIITMRELAWTPRHASWREGFATGLG